MMPSTGRPELIDRGRRGHGDRKDVLAPAVRVGAGEVMARYFTNVGPDRGPYLYRNAPAAIDVLARAGGRTPIGRARPATWVDASVTLFTIVDREFKAVQ
jgi:hypothetical protein